MAEFLNLQVYGVPIVTYGLVGLTTAVLAYATSISEMGEVGNQVSKSLTEITESPMASLSSMNPLASVSENAPSMSDLNPFSSKENASSLDESEKPSDQTIQEKPFADLKGGKKRRRKTPKSKKSGGKGKTKKN